MREILVLPYTPTANPKRIHEFFDKLSHRVQSLETLKQIKKVNGMVSLTLHKLPNIRGDLVRNEPEWESWDFVKFFEALRFGTERIRWITSKLKSRTPTGNVRNQSLVSNSAEKRSISQVRLLSRRRP